MRFETIRQRLANPAHAAAASLGRALVRREVAETDFLPAALEIVDTPPSPLARATTWTLMALLAVALVWATLGTVDIIAIAPGRIVPTGRTKLVQPLEAGVVRAIHVEDGRRVRAGDVLIEIDPTINAADQARLAKAYAQAALDVARLSSVRGAADGPLFAFIPPPEADPADLAVARRLIDAEVHEVRARLAALDSQIAQSRAARSAVDATVDKLADARSISARRYGVEPATIDRIAIARELSDLGSDIEVQRLKADEAESSITALEDQRRAITAEYKRRIAGELAEAQRRVTTLSDELVQARQRTRLQTLTAPVDGTVQQLAVHTVGGVVTPAQVLLAIVPGDSRLEIEAAVANRDIGFVHAGQAAQIKIDTFNFTRYGLIDGKVLNVSSDAVLRDGAAPGSAEAEAQRKGESGSGRQELVYTARIGLAQTRLQIDGREVDLAPGMAVTVEIRTGTRRIIEYLLSPLLRTSQQAMRER